MSLREFVPEEPAVERSLVLVNGTAPEPVRDMLLELFEDQPVSIEATDLPDQPEDTVLLLEDGTVLASSPLDAIRDTILLVNSDLYTTGTRGVEGIEVPDVIRGLTDQPFDLSGYPESNTEKLLLVLLSRLVERRALEAGAGTLRSSFQRLSRIRDEQGTEAVYEQLAARDGREVHVYGVPDWIPRELEVVIHGGTDADFRKAWFVIFDPETAEPGERGLLAYEVEPRRLRGVYTESPDRLAAVREYITRRM
ncbi:MAG: DICT sensory domain-containing protein [Halodesulfurarchaeum sp.]